MTLALVLALSLAQAPTLTARAVEALDEAYLHAREAPWQTLRAQLLAHPATTPRELERRLAPLREAELRILDADQLRSLQAEAAGQEKGIGLVDFAVTVDADGRGLRVVTPLGGSPAFEAGLRPKDLIVAIDGTSIRGQSHEAALAPLRGETGTVTLEVLRGAKRLTLPIPRRAWTLQPVAASRVKLGEATVGFLTIRAFTPDTGQQVREAITAMHADALEDCIVDLRHNPGGYLDSAALAASAFTGEVLGQLVQPDGTRVPVKSGEAPLEPLRLVVLIDDGTASAAEVLAAALRDLAGAHLVGARTAGRGQAQLYRPLSDVLGLLIPTASLETARGVRFVPEVGLTPEVTVPPSPSRPEEDLAYLAAATRILSPR